MSEPARFPSLDGLRAFSVAAVVWHHAGGSTCSDATLAGRGRHGVTLFFALSGFLITTLLLRERAATGRISLGRFYARRTLRIFPLYYATLGVYALLAAWDAFGAATSRRFFGVLPLYLSYASNFADDRDAPFGHAWSLACEEQFYLLWPPVLAALGPRRGAFVALGALVLNRAFEAGVAAGALSVDAFLVRAVLTLQPAIVLGVLAALVWASPAGRRALAPTFARRWSAPLAAAALVGVLAVPVDLDFPALADVAAAGLVLACAARPDHVGARLLRWRPIAALGAISYGIYLLHLLVQGAIGRVAGGALDGRPAARFAATFAAAAVVAAASYVVFERPFLRLKRRFAWGAAAAPAPVVGASVRRVEDAQPADHDARRRRPAVGGELELGEAGGL
ncbi:MAG TPA: acyltransferase [Planctomycetota bacterium]|nr:acyltransferase [Planctomycetota bacterium]